MEKNKATIVIDGYQVHGASVVVDNLPEGRPICQLFTRGTPATFSDVKFYTTDIDQLEVPKEEATYAYQLAVTEAPTAEKFGDALTGGKFTVTYFAKKSGDRVKKEFTLDSPKLP